MGIWDSARHYAKAGIYVNPVHVKRKPDGKKDVRPVGLWRQTSSRSLADIGAWEQDHPDAQLLIDCGKSKLLVVDCDGQEGIANWLALDPPPPLSIVSTPGGGQHWYYWEHPDHPIGNDQNGKVAPSVDIRGIGGFVFAPPSSDGQGVWEWLEGPDWMSDRPTPDVVIERMRKPSGDTTARESALDATESQDKPDDPLFDPSADRLFTDEQATAFIAEARRKLEATRQGFNGAINTFAMVCAHFPWLVDRERCGRLVIRSLGERTEWTAPDADDIRTIDSAYSATEAGRSWVATRIELSESDNGDGGAIILPSPAEPMAVARVLLETYPRPLCWWRGGYREHTGRHWEEVSDESVRQWLYRATEHAQYWTADKKGEPARKAWAPDAGKVNRLHDALSIGVVQHDREPEEIMALENGALIPVTRELLEHTPDRFNLTSLPFAYDPAADCPQWLDFLESVLPGDRLAHETIAEWFGYVLSGRTDMQKIAVLVGPKRCGKGTIARILKAMVGNEAWAAPTLARLGSEFGMASLIGKSVAAMGDVRWTSSHVTEAVPIMLGISGEDSFSVPRKHVADWIGKLGVRLMLMSNDAPVFNDASGALASRMVYVAFHRSFIGQEDLTLEGRLMTELPGILNWALDGLDRLARDGRFTQSMLSEELAEDVDRDASPITAWVEDRCVLDTTATRTVESLLTLYRDWLSSEGMTFTPSASRFGRDLRSAFGDKGVTIERKSNGAGGKHRVVTGIRPIAGASIPDDQLFDD